MRFACRATVEANLSDFEPGIPGVETVGHWTHRGSVEAPDDLASISRAFGELTGIWPDWIAGQLVRAYCRGCRRPVEDEWNEEFHAEDCPCLDLVIRQHAAYDFYEYGEPTGGVDFSSINDYFKRADPGEDWI